MGNENIKRGKYFNKKLKTILTQIPYSKLNLSQNLNAIHYNPIQIPKPKSYLNPNLKNQKIETNRWRIRDLIVEDTGSDRGKGLTVFSGVLSPLSMPDQISLSLYHSFSPSLSV